MHIETSHPTFRRLRSLLTFEEYVVFAHRRGFGDGPTLIGACGSIESLEQAAKALRCSVHKASEHEFRAGAKIEAAGLDIRDFELPSDAAECSHALQPGAKYV